MRKKIAVLLVLMMFLSLSSMAFTHPPGPPDHAASSRPNIETMTYLNLGDSIAFGMSADDGSSYYDLYSDYLWDYGIASAPNVFSMPGITSWELLGALAADEDLQEAVEQADVITVSIGGNNLLRGMIGALFLEYGLNPEEKTIIDLMGAIIAEGEEVWYEITAGLVAQLQVPDDDCPLWEGSNQFVQDWPMILGAINELNPNAHVIAMTIYNPIHKKESPEFHALVNDLLKPMNLAIRQNQGRRSSVANVHRAFLRDSNAIDFSVAFPPYLDPHPTNEGHQIIFEELMKVRNPRAFR